MPGHWKKDCPTLHSLAGGGVRERGVGPVHRQAQQMRNGAFGGGACNWMHDGGGAKNQEQQHLNVASEVSNQGQPQQQRPHFAATPHSNPPYICEQQPKNMCPSNGVQKSARGADVSDEDAQRAVDASLGVEEDDTTRRANEERLFLEKFNLSPGMPSAPMMQNATPAVTRSVVPTAVAEPPPAQRGGMLTKFSYECCRGRRICLKHDWVEADLAQSFKARLCRAQK